MCLYPTLRPNKKYTMNKKNGGNVPVMRDNRVAFVPTGCGRCMECRKQKGREWQVRLLEDVRHNKGGKFVTLTFSDESIYELTQKLREGGFKGNGYELDNAIATYAVRHFFERWRRKFKKSARHWLITELGHKGTENVHLHGVIWTDQPMEVIRERWKYGYIWPKKDDKTPNYVNERTANYMTKYVQKMDFDHRLYKPKIYNSEGIGAGYLEREDSKKHQYKGKDTIQTYKTRTGHEIAMPIYLRNKLWTEEEREQLWLHTLDKNERWVGGERIRNANTTEGEQEYFATLEHYREINTRLGYGDDRKDYDRKRYESDLRKLRQAERLAKGKAKLKKKE